MNKTINLQNNTSKTGFRFGLVAMLAISFLGAQIASAAITTSLDYGDQGSQVTELQTYLATNASIYPSGLVTGYFGPLTQAAVQKFQTAQGIVSSGTPETTGYGRVGPMTMARINSLLGSGGGQTYWDTVPTLSSPSVQRNSTNATITWTTNEPTQGQVYYNTLTLVFNEATGPRQQPYVSGAYSTDNGGLISHSITIVNLQPNTTYHFLTRAVDNVGNMSMTWPSSFTTNQ